MPPKARIKHASQPDKRHDAGLAAPGKRITKAQDRQPSPSGAGSPQPSSPANGRVPQSPTPPLPQHGSAAGSVNASPRCWPDSNGGAGTSESVNGNGMHTPVKRGSTSEQEDDKKMENKSAAVQPSHADGAFAKETTALKNLASQASSTMALAATILTACPLRDAIAILILLLSLPSAIIIVVHGLFASLTFVPPAAGFAWGSWSVLPSFGDWFHATPGGGPSLFTILLSDLAMTTLHLCCSTSVQSILTDLAQAVIALSLGGAAAGADSSKNVAFCCAIILTSHLAKYKGLHVMSMQYLTSSLRSIGINVGDGVDFEGSSFIRDWVRLLLGCHILAQGMLTLVRRWVAGANQKQQGSKLDAEQAALLDSGKLAMLNLAEPVNSVSMPMSPAAAMIARESKEKASNRKKRKQANQVRSQQPLWAALASTKVTFMKEMEQKYLTEDKKEASTTAGPDTTEVKADRFWILDIGPTSINFRAELYGEDTKARKAKPAMMDDKSISAGIDKQKPFFVRLNGADWASTRIASVSDEVATGEDGAKDAGNTWDGEIYGLSPLTKYSCEFVDTHDHFVFFTTNLITLNAPNAEQVVAIPNPASPQSLRPMSPTSTLKQSIIAAEAKREDMRNRLKRLRKEHKTAAQAVRRDIEQLQSKVASSGGQDDRSRSRILQLKQHIKQAEEAIDAHIAEMDSLGEIPAEDIALASARRKSYDAAMEAKTQAKTAVDTARAAAHKELAALEAESSSLRQKRERLSSRRQRVWEAYDKLVSEANAGVTARNLQRLQAFEEREKIIDQLRYHTEVARAQEAEYHLRTNEIYAFVNQDLPEGDLPGTHGNGWAWRARSSSMLSGYSGFTDEFELGGRKSPASSGSGRMPWAASPPANGEWSTG